DHEACILCDRCIRGCDDIRNNWVLARRGKGYQAGIAFDNNLPMGESSCVSCGECMVSCPTGALTNKKVIDTQLGDGTDVAFEELRKLEVFKNVSGTFLKLNQNAIRKRVYKAGEIVCREAEYGSTAYYILEGQADVFITMPVAHATTRGGSTGIVHKLKNVLVNRSQHKRAEESTRRVIPLAAPI